MAVFSAIKNKKNQKIREGIEDLALKCGDENHTGNVDVRITLSKYTFIYNILS